MATNSSFLDRYLPYVLRRADQVLSAPFYAVLSDCGVALSEWRVLAVLHELGELSVADLAVAALSPQPTVTHALGRLESRGLVARTTGTVDKRQRFVSVTPAGAKLTAQLVARAQDLESAALNGAGEIETLLARLSELTASLEAASHLQPASSPRSQT